MGLHELFLAFWYYKYCCSRYPCTYIPAHSCFCFCKTEPKVQGIFSLRVNYCTYFLRPSELDLLIFFIFVHLLGANSEILDSEFLKTYTSLTTRNTEQPLIAFPLLWNAYADTLAFIVSNINSLGLSKCKLHQVEIIILPQDFQYLYALLYSLV